MGGKLDLSQIRSPRMARRVAKNANDEGIEGPPKSAIESKQSPAVSPPANLLVPQVAVPVFPPNVPPQPYVNRMSQSPSVNRTLSNGNYSFMSFLFLFFFLSFLLLEMIVQCTGNVVQYTECLTTL